MKVPRAMLVEAQARAGRATRARAVRAELIDALRGRSNVVVSSQRLSMQTGLSVDDVDAELSSVLVDHVEGTLGAVASHLGTDVLRLHAKGWSCGPAGVYEYLVVPSAFEIEQWIGARDHTRLDAALSATKTRVRPRTDRAPRLRWVDGTPLSMGAQAWVLTQLLSERFVRQAGEQDAAQPVRGAAELIAPALDPPSTVGLAQWVLDAKLPASSTARVPRNDAVIDWLASQVDAGEVSRSRALTLMGTEHVQARRWAFFWGELRSPRFPDALSDERIEGLWPIADDPTGTQEQWSEWISQVLERAMIEQRSWSGRAFAESYLDHPTPAPIVAGLVFMVGDEPVVFVDGRARGPSGPIELLPERRVRVAHPAEWTAGWPKPSVAAPFAQRERPVLGSYDILAPPSQMIPHRAWKRRASALRLVPDVGTGGGTTAEMWLLEHYRVRIGHAGYGSGYGGARPIEVTEVTVGTAGTPAVARVTRSQRSGWDALPDWLVSEVACMLQVLFGERSTPIARDWPTTARTRRS